MTLLLGPTLRGEEASASEPAPRLAARFRKEARAFLKSLASLLDIPGGSVQIRECPGLGLALGLEVEDLVVIATYGLVLGALPIPRRAVEFVRLPCAQLAPAEAQLRLVNRMRARVGRRPLDLNGYLARAAPAAGGD